MNTNESPKASKKPAPSSTTTSSVRSEPAGTRRRVQLRELVLHHLHDVALTEAGRDVGHERDLALPAEAVHLRRSRALAGLDHRRSGTVPYFTGRHGHQREASRRRFGTAASARKRMSYSSPCLGVGRGLLTPATSMRSVSATSATFTPRSAARSRSMLTSISGLPVMRLVSKSTTAGALLDPRHHLLRRAPRVLEVRDRRARTARPRPDAPTEIAATSATLTRSSFGSFARTCLRTTSISCCCGLRARSGSVSAHVDARQVLHALVACRRRS